MSNKERKAKDLSLWDVDKNLARFGVAPETYEMFSKSGNPSKNSTKTETNKKTK